MFLLKQGAKTVTQDRKRRKISVLAFPDGTKPEQQNEQQQESNVQMAAGGHEDNAGPSSKMASRRAQKPPQL